MRVLLSMVCCALPLMAQKVTIGEYVPHALSTAHPYQFEASAQPVAVMKEYVYYPQATYIAIHFKRFDLAPGDFVIVRSMDGDQHRVYEGLGRHNLGNTPDGFFATHVKGDMAVVEFYSTSGEEGYGFDIDFYGRGYNDYEIQEFWNMGLGEEMNLPEPAGMHRSICTTDDTREVKCYQVSEPMAYDKARAVARLTLNGNAHCTGWLIGCDGHVMTNEHCIGSQSQLNNIDFEFMAEGADCATNCASALACPGTIEASGGTLVQVDAPLDFALVLPDTSTGTGTNLPATYGYFQLRESGAVLNERIYIAQHPAGWGKRLAMESSYPGEPGGFASVVSINEAPCSGGPGDIGYWADTQGGSSGSPVIGYSDHRIVALHHCRGSAFCTSGNPGTDDPNRGVPIQAVITALGANLPNCATCQPPNAPTGLSATPNGDNQIDLSWVGVVEGTNEYNIYRALGPCTPTNWTLLVSNHATTSYSDTTVSGGSTYSYKITTLDTGSGCESADSNCSEALATGDCTLPPSSPANLMAVNAQTMTCAINLSWDASTAACGGASVEYNVYRSETSGFMPSGANYLASTPFTNYSDATAMYGIQYFYIVRAEDNTGNGSGPFFGNEDTNTNEVAGLASGPDATQFEDDMESGPANWVTGAGPSNTSVNPFSIVMDGVSPTNSWFVSDEGLVKDQHVATAAAIAITPGAPTVLEFDHRHNTESNWDGGVLEYSTDGGSTWFDILDTNGGSVPANAARFIQGAYVGPLNSSANPLGGRMAWHGDNGAWATVQVDLFDFGGENLLLRWRFGCDASVGDVGWYIDNIRVFYGSSCENGNVCDTLEYPMWPDMTILTFIDCINPM
ncbi:MAG: trypsin-like peptidase domain-containing protein [Acidobacteria bacterium]|nr:trypsin-like peptidase domain-containing protein [Acidobacteriota bacterium]